MAPSSFVEEPESPRTASSSEEGYQEKKGKKYEGNPSFSSQEIKDFFEAISKSPSGGIHSYDKTDPCDKTNPFPHVWDLKNYHEETRREPAAEAGGG